MEYKMFMYVVLLVIHLTFSEAGVHRGSDDLIVELANPVGKIRGHILQSDNGYPFYAFQDIPYAQPPIGKNRFKPPKPLDPWDNILNTTINQKICPQASFPTGKFSANGPTENEDCLYLNVYTPVKPGLNASLPVFFWIHGGAFMSGSGSSVDYNPKFLIDYDIVIVTINYRIGALGFLTTDDEFLPGNLGYKDQHFALRWANENIHLFGGDPKKITVGGESAGGMSSGSQLLSALNKGLMRGIIQSSGSGIGTVVYQTHFKKWAFKFGNLVDNSFNSTSSKDLLEVLLNASWEDIIKLQSQLHTDEKTGFMEKTIWNPIIESGSNDDAIVTGHMHDDFIQGNFNLVPVFIGFNSEESLLFLQMVSNKAFVEASKLFDQDARLLISEDLNIADREGVGKELKKLYTNTTFLEDKVAFVKYTSDEVFIRSTLREAEAISKYVPVYLYELSWDEGHGEIPGVAHASDLSYLWFDPGSSFPFIPELRKPMLKLWTNFIKTLNPTPEVDEDLQNINWPTVKPNAPLQYLNINKTFEILENPRQYDKIKEIFNKNIQKPYNVY